MPSDYDLELLAEMPTTRRDFLVRAAQVALTATLIDAFVPAYALAGNPGRDKATKPRGTLVVIFLRGGCDALNMVIPYSEPLYRSLRPTLAIAPRDVGSERGVVALNRQFGLHPALAPLYPLYESKQFAPIVSVGSPHPSRSHFDCQDFMEYAAPGSRTVKQGWLNHFQQLTAGATTTDQAFRALALQGLLPRSLRGPHRILAVPQLNLRGSKIDPLAAFDEIYGGAAMPGSNTQPGAAASDDPVLVAGRYTIDALRKLRGLISQPSKTEAAAGYPEHGFGNQLRQLARLIKANAGLEVACIDYPGWDHHVRQGGVTGTMSTMLGVLATGLAAFAKDLGNNMDNVAVLTMSEFGRTVRENGNMGTDHGHGGVMLAMGGLVKGGRVYGRWNGLEDKHLYQGRDLPANTDYRSVFDETLRQVFGFTPGSDFFPAHRVSKREHLGFLRKPS